MIKKYFPFIFLLFSFINLVAFTDVVDIEDNENKVVDKSFNFFIDEEQTISIEHLIKHPELFNPINENNFGIIKGDLWYKLDFKNKTDNEIFFIELPSALINSVDFYQVNNNEVLKHSKSGLHYPYSIREIKHRTSQFSFYLSKDNKTTVYLKVHSDYAITYPIVFGEFSNIKETSNNIEFWIIVYVSFMLAMIIYNFFIFVSVKDNSYLYYVLYTIFIMLTQLSMEGIFLEKYGENTTINVTSIIVLSSLSGFFFIFFTDSFLKLRIYARKLRRGYIGLIAIYMLALIFASIGKIRISTQLLDLGGAYGAIFTLVISVIVYRRGFRPAGIFLISWIVFLLGITLYVMKNQGILEFNDLTNHTLQIGTVIEVMLLSFALASRINLLKKEKDIIQKKQLATLAENQKIIAEQNVLLEEKVKVRTKELENTNVELNKTMNNLQSAQLQLIEQEKMASLGQLTAGIAHEINNPINFVISNIKPLSQDVGDLMELLNKYQELSKEKISDLDEYKEITDFEEEIDIEYTTDEIAKLLEGIEEGANRTRYVVRGLRTFSRLDESNFNAIDLLEGLDSTLSLLTNQTKNEITIIKNYDNIPKVECNGSKLNQVFMNLLTNSIQALKEYAEKEKDDKKLEIKITVKKIDDNNVEFSFKDNGPGISKENQKKIFDPFFTTKDVGKGTGLGLSIVFKVIKNHKGTIVLNSELGKGAEFVITIPILNKLVVENE